MARSACVSCALPRGAPYAACPASLAQRRPPPSQNPALPPASCPCLKAPRSRFLEGSAPRLMRPHTLPHSSFLLLLKPRRLLQRRRSRQASRRPPDRPLRRVAASFWAGAPPPRSRAAFLSVTFNALTLCTHLPAHPEIPCTRTPPNPTPHPHTATFKACMLPWPTSWLASQPSSQPAGQAHPSARHRFYSFFSLVAPARPPSSFTVAPRAAIQASSPRTPSPCTPAAQRRMYSPRCPPFVASPRRRPINLRLSPDAKRREELPRPCNQYPSTLLLPSHARSPASQPTTSCTTPLPAPAPPSLSFCSRIARCILPSLAPPPFVHCIHAVPCRACTKPPFCFMEHPPCNRAAPFGAGHRRRQHGAVVGAA